MGITIEKATVHSGQTATTPTTLFWTADRSTLVDEGDVRAAFLAYAPVDPVPTEHLALIDKAQGGTVNPSTSVVGESGPETIIPPKTAPVKRTTRKPKG